MKLYRETSLPDRDATLEVLWENASLQELKSRARQIAISTGVLDISWTFGEDSGASTQFPHELELTETTKLIIRNW